MNRRYFAVGGGLPWDFTGPKCAAFLLMSGNLVGLASYTLLLLEAVFRVVTGRLDSRSGTKFIRAFLFKYKTKLVLS